MNLTMVLNRLENWYYFEDVGLNPFYYCILILEKLSTNLKKGLEYNRIEIISSLGNRKNFEALKILDNAIVILKSRNLIDIREEDVKMNKLFITKEGMDVLINYRKEYENYGN